MNRVHDVVDEHVRDQRAHEQQRRRTRILDVDDACVVRAAEVVRDDLQAAPRRTVLTARVERHHEGRVRALVHAEHDVLDDRLARERNPLFRYMPKDDARIRRRVDCFEVDNARRQFDTAAHGRVEQRLLRLEVPEHRRRRDAEVGGDVGERGGREALLRERGARCLKDLLAADRRWTSHL
jgi:hypothetical protein